MTDLNALKAANARRWAVAKPTRDMAATAKHLVDAKQRYKTVEGRTGVPWFVIAVIHMREASQNWNTQLGQGDPLHSISVHVPAGRGPFDTWEQGAYDALVNCSPHAARWTDWSSAGALTLLETYNGLGYAAGPSTHHEDGTVIHYPPQPSPYIWAGTNQYAAGKYTRDRFYDPSFVDPQPGCAAMIMAMMKLDPTITFTGVTILPPRPVPPEKPAQPSVTNPAPGSIGAFIASVFNSIFRRK